MNRRRLYVRISVTDSTDCGGGGGGDSGFGALCCDPLGNLGILGNGRLRGGILSR